MSRFRKPSHAIWHCQYHFVWIPKYRYRISKGLVGAEVNQCIRTFSERLEAEVVELNVRVDHAHLLAMVPPKVAISEFVGTLKGRTAILVFNKFRHLKYKPY
jgi:REP-associated tyrosine transposase